MNNIKIAALFSRFRHNNGEKHANGPVLSQTERLLPWETRTGVSGKPVLQTQVSFSKIKGFSYQLYLRQAVFSEEVLQIKLRLQQFPGACYMSSSSYVSHIESEGVIQNKGHRVLATGNMQSQSFRVHISFVHVLCHFSYRSVNVNLLQR